jgi:hypothetical protein
MVLVDLGMPPIQDIPQLPKSPRGVLPAADLILKHLQEVALGCLSHRLSIFFFISPLGTTVIYVFDIYIYIYIYIYMGKTRAVTCLSPCVPNRNELGPWGLG